MVNQYNQKYDVALMYIIHAVKMENFFRLASNATLSCGTMECVMAPSIGSKLSFLGSNCADASVLASAW